MSWEEFAKSVGVSWPDMVGGAVGGIYRGILMRGKESWVDALLGAVAGLLAAMFFTPLLAWLIDLPNPQLRFGLAWGVGTFSQVACLAGLGAFRNWRFKAGGFETGVGSGRPVREAPPDEPRS